VQTLQDFLQRWQQRGIYTRLFVPIFILIFAVSGLRYYLLIDAEVKDAMMRSATELRHSAHYLIPALSSLSLQGDRQGMQQLLVQEVRASPAIWRISWRYRQEQFLEQDKQDDMDDVQTGVPAWFNALLKLQPETFGHQVRLSNGEIAMLRLDTTVGFEKRHIWEKVVTQAKISLAIIFTIYFLLGLILRSNAKTISRLASATDKFKKGQHAVRMSVSGTAEARALATTFNSMADEVQALLLTLQRSQRANSEQLHFTWQLLHALPIPIFFQDQHGICQRVNRAWEQMFGVLADQVVGQTMPPLVTEITEQVTDDIPTRLDETADGKLVMEITILVAGQMRDVIYYQASFTNVDGDAVGSIGALIDISERNDAQAALAFENERVETTLASIGDAVISTDVDGQVLMLNKVAQQLTGWSREEACKHGLLDIFSLSEVGNRARLVEFVDHICDSDEIFQANNQLLMANDGRQIEIDYTAAPIRQQDGTVTGCVLVFRDVSEKRRLIQQLSWQAGHDILTGLENRAALAVRFDAAIHHAREQQIWLAVCLLDLDHFQAINEKYGHEFADKLLQLVARRLEASVGSGNSVARLGGDEFVLLLQDQHSVASVERELAILQSGMAEPYEIDGRALSLSASIGVAIYPRDDINPDTLLRCADQAMYQAKLNGRNQFHLFDAEQDQQLRTHHNQRTRVRQALLNGEMRLYFQPKVNMRLGQVVGMEALIRWQHPEEGIVGPLNFLPLVEHTDLIIDIGEWVLHQAMAQLRAWGSESQRWIVSVNIAARHFQCKDFFERLENILNAYPDVAPERLEIEILESAALQDVQHVREVMLACQQLGVSFALDDFGTGYSSLSYLKRLPANTLKIDQSFVRDMLDDKDDLAVISAVIGLARAFNREVIAEGVESAEHGVALMRLGCYLAQGFGVARPMPAAQIADWARDYVAPLLWDQARNLQWEGA
jgi:diguanylate cyclase (GGDEF)-like protein/PAS domain S-box-containing protein